MKNYIMSIILITTVLSHGCDSPQRDVKGEESPKEKIETLSQEKEQKALYKKVKEKKISELSGTAKQNTIDDWVTLLRNEPAFLNAEKSLRTYTSEVLNRDRQKGGKTFEGNPGDKNDRIAHFESRGIKNPARAVSSQSDLIKNYLLVIQKYPELREIDRPTLKIILSRAAGKADITELRKRNNK